MTKKQTDNILADTDNPYLPFMRPQQSGFGNLMGGNAAWIESLGKMSAEFASFVAERINEDVKAQHEMMHCHDASELQKIQGQFVQTALDQYQAETDKLVQMGISALSNATEEKS